ncbi:hypothetical protein P9314_01625 [Paenibacillus validus]|uniref:Uncharacterized protein n=1 Tax=Paenibacillus validus TaxID=44253 RepID=A0A7X2ZBY3_9BACL|nr:hypothetical protein [Paenibacillus validus]MED4599412.1 hypothetical protein [Paenibacillus validus]MED4605124.1 hypothetical protein [Paenibacillus validus]MUG72021.1 hypothetical protein [Paenibacillus validus]
MSQAAIPNHTMTLDQTVPLLLASIAQEEFALAYIMNAEAERSQFLVGTLTTKADGAGASFSPTAVSLSDLLALNASVRKTLQDVINKDMLLNYRFENVLNLIQATPKNR